MTIDRPIGQFLAEGQDMLRVWGVSELDEAARDTLYSHVGLASERQMRQDVAFGIRQLVDIAERALSPGINDPTTATQCLDELHRILREHPLGMLVTYTDAGLEAEHLPFLFDA